MSGAQCSLHSPALFAVCILLLYIVQTAAADRVPRGIIYQDQQGRLHISSSASNQSVLVNEVDVLAKLREMDALTEEMSQVRAANLALGQQMQTANASLLELREVNTALEQRLAKLERTLETGGSSNSTSGSGPGGSPTHSPIYHVSPVNNGTVQWIRQWGSSSFDSPTALTTDSLGFVYMTGYSSGAMDGNVNAGSNDLFLVKYGPDGTKLWTKMMGTSKGDYGRSVVTDSQNNVFVVGHSQDNFDGLQNAGLGSDIIVVKFNNNGGKIWSRMLGSPTVQVSDIPYAAAMDRDYNVVLGGYTSGSLDGFVNAGGSGSGAKADGVLAKYANNGDLLWKKQFGGTLQDFVYGLAVDSQNNFVATGYTETSLFGNAHGGMSDWFVAKFDENATLLWSRQIASLDMDIGKAVAIDSSNNIYTAGHSSGNLDGMLNIGLADVMLFKFDTNGAQLWSRKLATPFDEQPTSIAIDSRDYVYVAGYTEGAFSGHVSLGGRDVFVACFDPAGDVRWLKQLGGKSSSADLATAITLDKSNTLYMAGETDGQMDESQTPAGSTDFFVVQML